MPTLSVIVPNLTTVPSSVQPAAEPKPPQDSAPAPLVVNTVDCVPSAVGNVYETPAMESEEEVKVVAPVTPSVEDKVVVPVTPKVEEAVTAPVKVEAPVTVNVPDIEGESFKAREIDSPNFTSPPPVKLVPAETVTLAADKAELGILEKVLSEPEIDLFFKVSVVVLPTKVSVASGKVMIFADPVGIQFKVPVGPLL